MIRARRQRAKYQPRTPKTTKDAKEKKVSKSSIKEDILPYLSISENKAFVGHEGSPLPEVSVPSPDDAALPKPSLCSLNEKELKSIVPESCDACNPVLTSETVEKQSNHVFLLKSPSRTKSKSGKKKDQVQSHQLTEYYPIRRSNRKPLCSVKKETHQMVEIAIISGKEEGFEVKEFPDKGRGVVTKKNVRKGDFVLEYAGELISMEEARKRETRYAAKANTGCYMYYFKHGNKQYCVDATKESGRLGRLVNHSKKGNLKTQSFLIKDSPHLILVACRDIFAGEELLYDYGDRSKESLEAHPWLAL